MKQLPTSEAAVSIDGFCTIKKPVMPPRNETRDRQKRGKHAEVIAHRRI
jgi:hypothetical protein